MSRLIKKRGRFPSPCDFPLSSYCKPGLISREFHRPQDG